jgi:hypothetical protein
MPALRTGGWVASGLPGLGPLADARVDMLVRFVRSGGGQMPKMMGGSPDEHEHQARGHHEGAQA